MSRGEDVESAFLSLPPDVLFNILSYCDTRSLGRLCRTCHKINDIISEDYLWISKSKNAVACNQLSNLCLQRSCIPLIAREKCRISLNWRKARCREEYLIIHYTSYMPWLQLQSDFVWYSKGSSIYCYPRMKNGFLKPLPTLTLRGHLDDVCKFVCRDGLVISGGRDSYIYCWNEHSGHFLFSRRCHNSDINSVDIWKNVIVTGSRDKTAKILLFKNGTAQSQYTLNIGDRVWSVAVTLCGRSVLCGSAGYNNIPPLQLFDIETGKKVCSLGSGYRNGAGVLQVYPESVNELISCGYDTNIRLWDTRCGPKCVTRWEDPHDSVVYCVTSDHHVTMVSGTSRYGLVRLWDKRVARCLQKFYVGRRNSPVYSAAFDPYHMYVALDWSLNILDFSGYYDRYNHPTFQFNTCKINCP